MKVQAFVKPGSRKEELAWDGRQLIVRVDAPPVEGAANQRLVELIAKLLHLSKTRVQVVKGLKSRHKTLEIEMGEAELTEFITALPQVPRQE